jgi:ubiquinone biosynthesis protein UbiJ
MRRLIEKALNHYLALDPESRSRLNHIENRVILIQLQGIDVRFQWIFSDGKIHIKPADFAVPDTIITGTPLSLLHLSLFKSERKRFFAEEASIEGDLELGREVMEIFDSLEIDWEEYLSHWIGDVPAHQVGHFARKIKKFSQHFRETIAQNINEFVHEECEIFPPKEALQDFFNDVDLIRMDTDRLEMQVLQLEKMLETN